MMVAMLQTSNINSQFSNEVVFSLKIGNWKLEIVATQGDTK
jgi:hypothetical protein